MAKNYDLDQEKDFIILPSTLTLVDGVIHFAGTTKEFLSDIKQLPTKKDDVFIASYPKSGTTWMCEIVWQIYHNGKIDTDLLQNRTPFIDMEFRNDQNISKSREELRKLFSSYSTRVFKTHLRFDEAPMGDRDTTKPKYIYVARNPKDVAVSYYYHYKNLKHYEYDRTWDEFFDMFINEKVLYGGWFDHVIGWWAHRDDRNVLFLKYEDMKKDHLGIVQEVARFVGKDISAETIQQITNQTTFQAMSSDEGRFVDKERLIPDPNAKFVRKGRVGGWKEYFTDEQNKIFDEMYGKKMAGSGLDFEFSLN